MADETIDHISYCVDEMISCATPIPPRCCICRMPDLLRNVNKNANEPEMVAIGPYHRDKDHLKAMQLHKIQNLKFLVRQRNENDASRYVDAMINLEERACNYYEESITIGKHE